MKAIQENIALISDYKANVCLDSTAVADDSALREELSLFFSPAALKPCIDSCDACVTFALEVDVS